MMLMFGAWVVSVLGVLVIFAIIATRGPLPDLPDDEVID